jgi:hypothetical protein
MAQEPEFKPGQSPATGTSEESDAALARMGANDSLLERLVNPHGGEIHMLERLAADDPKEQCRMDLGEIPRLDGVRERRTEVRNVVHVEGGSGPQPSDHRPPVDPEIAQIDAMGTRRDSFGRIPSSAFERE